MVNLIMHCGGHHVSRGAVQDAPTPERTNTWVPIPHNRLLEIAGATIEQQGYTVINEAHGLWGEGARYFGLLELADQNPSRDYSLILGLRNSHDKSFPASFALGSQVLVCDNLSFSRVIPVTQLPLVLSEWREPSHDAFKEDGRSVWRLYNAFTESFKTRSLAMLPKRSQALHGLMDRVCQLAA